MLVVMLPLTKGHLSSDLQNSLVEAASLLEGNTVLPFKHAIGTMANQQRFALRAGMPSHSLQKLSSY